MVKPLPRGPTGKTGRTPPRGPVKLLQEKQVKPLPEDQPVKPPQEDQCLLKQEKLHQVKQRTNGKNLSPNRGPTGKTDDRPVKPLQEDQW